MHRNALAILIICGTLLAITIAAGCTGSSGTTGSAPSDTTLPVATAGTTGTPQSIAPAASVVVKNTGAQEIHAWIASDQVTWAGNSDNHIEPNGQIQLAYTSSGGSTGSTSPSYVCIGRSEKVLKCTSITPAVGALIWDGTSLTPGS
jgi:hypothetical protein